MGGLVVGPAAARRFPWKLILQVTGAAVVITLLLVRTFLVELVRVHGNYMAPSLTEGDLVLVRRTRAAGRGDVVVLELGGQVVLRRVIGVPGDRLATDAGVLTLNELPVDTQLAGNFAYREETARGPRTHRQHLLQEEIETGRWQRVLGDHLGAGRPWRLSFDPVTVDPGFLFVLCDNRRECPALFGDDDHGVVPASAVVGVAQSLLRSGGARVVPLSLSQGDALPLTAGPLPAPAPTSPGSPDSGPSPEAPASVAPLK